MTKEEAIQILRANVMVACDTSDKVGYGTPLNKAIEQALDMAIKALEQNTVSEEEYTAEYTARKQAEYELWKIKEQQPTSDDCIKREAVKEFVEYIQSIKDNHNEHGTPINYGTICDLVIRGWKLMDLPPVTPTHKQGEWIKEYDNSALDGLYHCSVCSRKLWISKEESVSDYPFCHCGAEMRGEDNV